jgi:outer membrane protein TolC
MLLHMDPSTRLVANWEHLAPITLVDESQSEEELIQQAMAQGPGVAEVATLLSALDEQQRQLRRIGLVPTVSIASGLGAFGGGEGSALGDFGDRTDVGVSAYWDVLKIMGTKHTREMFAVKRRQAVLEQQKLEARLAAGVKVARSRAVEARKMIREAEVEVDLAIQRYALSKKRMEAGLLQMPALEMLPAIGILGSARANYLQAVIEFNKAQVELMYLLGRHVPEATYLEPNCPPRRYVDGRLVPSEPSHLMPVEAVAEEPPAPAGP